VDVQEDYLSERRT